MEACALGIERELLYIRDFIEEAVELGRFIEVERALRVGSHHPNVAR